MNIYVIAHDGGYEGYSPPIQAFHNLEEAKAALALMNSGSASFDLFEVPVWPERATAEWFRIEPMKDEQHGKPNAESRSFSEPKGIGTEGRAAWVGPSVSHDG